MQQLHLPSHPHLTATRGLQLACIAGMALATGAVLTGGCAGEKSNGTETGTGTGTGGTQAQPNTGGVPAISSTGGTAAEAEMQAKLDKLVMEVPLHTMFAEENTEAAHAGGSWKLNGDDLDFEFGTSSFTCDGPGAGESGTFKVIELTATVLSVEISSEDSDNRMTFSRVGTGTDVVGTWKMDDGEFIITFQSDGTLVASGAQGECEEDARESNGYYSDEGCYFANLERSSAIVADGRFEDWSAARPIEAAEQNDADEMIEVAGADLTKLRVAASQSDLFLLLETKDRLNSNFQGRDGDSAGMYEITIRHDANGGGSRMLMLIYDPESERWRNRSGEEGLTIDAGDRGLEISINWASLDNPKQVYEISTRSRSCNDGPNAACEIWDEGPCVGENKP